MNEWYHTIYIETAHGGKKCCLHWDTVSARVMFVLLHVLHTWSNVCTTYAAGIPRLYRTVIGLNTNLADDNNRIK